MATIVDEAVCIRHWDWSETSQTVSLLTRAHGIIRGLAKGARREKGAFSGGIELATLGELVAIVKPTGALATLVSWDLRETYSGVRRSLGAFHAGMYAIDLVHHSVTDGDPHPGLFGAVRTVLGALGADEQANERVLLEFQWALLTETGYRPDLGEVVVGEVALFSPDLGRVVAFGQDAWRVRASTLALLSAMDGEGLGAGADPDQVRRANRLLAAYLRHVFGREVPSMRALGWGEPLGRGGEPGNPS